MDPQNGDKRELSEQFDSSPSAIGTSKEFQHTHPGETKRSDEVNKILDACGEHHDLDLLIRLATSAGGLINDDVRKVACKSSPDLKCPYFPTLTASKGRFCLAIEARSPSPPALLAPGEIFQIIKMKIKSSLT